LPLLQPTKFAIVDRNKFLRWWTNLLLLHKKLPLLPKQVCWAHQLVAIVVCWVSQVVVTKHPRCYWNMLNTQVTTLMNIWQKLYYNV
jgi:hypothetical protein